MCGSMTYPEGLLTHNGFKNANSTWIHDKHFNILSKTKPAFNILSKTKSAFRTSGFYYSHLSRPGPIVRTYETYNHSEFPDLYKKERTESTISY